MTISLRAVPPWKSDPSSCQSCRWMDEGALSFSSCGLGRSSFPCNMHSFCQRWFPSLDWDGQDLWIHVSVSDNSVCLFCDIKSKLTLCSQETLKSLCSLLCACWSPGVSSTLLSLSHTRADTIWQHTLKGQIVSSTCCNTAAATKAGRKSWLELLEKHGYECGESKVEKYRMSKEREGEARGEAYWQGESLMRCSLKIYAVGSEMIALNSGGMAKGPRECSF